MKKLLAISLALILALGMVSIAAAEDVITIGFAQVGHESDWRAANTLDYQNTFTAENGYELTEEKKAELAAQVQTERQRLEKQAADLNVPLAQRVAAKNKLFSIQKED